MFGCVGDVDGTGEAGELDDSAVGVGFDELDAGDGAELEEAEHGRPVVGRTVGEEEGDFRGGRCGGGFSPEFAGRAVVELLEGFIETADTAEAAGHGDVDHGEAGLMDELFGEKNAAGLRDADGVSPDVALEETAEVALADLESIGEGCDVCVVECAGLDQF